ncbi:hypothetical protein BDR26DRAFT_561003 [Obelidium mucronatum]|nr:hypothetical protein BDR26DRAFT_561003 [Obelidium mucronatum]
MEKVIDFLFFYFSTCTFDFDFVFLGIPSNNPSKSSNNPSKSPKSKSPKKLPTSKASAAISSSAAVSTPESIRRATRRTARMLLTAPPGWTVRGIFTSETGLPLAAVVPAPGFEVSKEVRPDCPIGWNVEWCNDINDWYVQPECPDGWTLGWSSTQSAWYFVDASDKSWWSIPKETKATTSTTSTAALDGNVENDPDLEDFEEIRTMLRNKEKKRKKNGMAVGSDEEAREKEKKKSKKKREGIIVVVAHDVEIKKKKKTKKLVEYSEVGLEEAGKSVEVAEDVVESGDIEMLLNVLASAAENATPGNTYC